MEHVEWLEQVCDRLEKENAELKKENKELKLELYKEKNK